MLHHITFSENPVGGGIRGYEQRLPSLKGKTFDFKPGLNVIIGKNGCGKTSLLNVIRKLTFCDGTYSSDIVRGHGEWQLHRKNIFKYGYWQDVELVGDYKRALWNLRKDDDVPEYDWCASVENFSQRFDSGRLSEGQSAFTSIKRMMYYLFYGYDHSAEQNIENGKKSRDFKKTVLDVIDREVENLTKRGRDKNDSWYEMWSLMQQYYINNAIEVNGENSEFKDYNGITMLLDEPDKGMDIFNVSEVYDFLFNHHTKRNCTQIICVLHNIGMIHKFKSVEGVNFIELSEGYLEKVERFLK